MVRALRIEYCGAMYHITSRGNKKEDIYLSNEDRVLFLDLFTHVCNKCNWVCHAYCLMSNHYHLLIETPLGNLSKGMQLLNGIYTQKFNHKHRRAGHVFQGRFKGILIEKESYLLELSRYIVLNPVRAKMVLSPEEWTWSSYNATINQVPKPTWLSIEFLLSTFSPHPVIATDKYKRFVHEGINAKSPWSNLKNQIFLGSEAFVDEMQSKMEQEKILTYIPQSHYKPVKESLTKYSCAAQHRNECIKIAYATGQFSLVEIGKHFGLHYSWVSRIVRNNL